MKDLNLYWDFAAPAEGPIVVYVDRPIRFAGVVREFPYGKGGGPAAIEAAEHLIREIESGRMTLKEACR